MLNIAECRQTCRLKVKVAGIPEPQIVVVLMAHQVSDGRNKRPVGERVYLTPLGEYASSDVEVLEILPWKD